MIYTITLGDWSGDGHSISETVLVDVPDQFDFATLKANYEKNVLELGIDPSKIAEDYQDTFVDADVAQRLFAAGLDRESIEEYDGEYSVDSDMYLEILMFFVGRGLDGFSYEVVTNNYPSLFGGYESISRDHYGYGLYGF